VNTVSNAITGQSRVKMVREGRPLLRENLAETDPPPSKTSIYNQCWLVSSQP